MPIVSAHFRSLDTPALVAMLTLWYIQWWIVSLLLVYQKLCKILKLWTYISCSSQEGEDRGKERTGKDRTGEGGKSPGRRLFQTSTPVPRCQHWRNDDYRPLYRRRPVAAAYRHPVKSHYSPRYVKLFSLRASERIGGFFDASCGRRRNSQRCL